MPTTPRSNDPRDNLGDYVLGADGKPIIDRYGRPVRRRVEGARQVRPEQQARPERQYSPRRTPQHSPRPPHPPRPSNETRIVPSREPARQAPVGRQPARRPSAQQQPTPREDLRRPTQVPPRRPREQAPVPMAVSESRVAAQPAQPAQRSGPRGRPRKRRRAGCFSLVVLALVAIIALVLLVDARLTRIDALPDERIANTAGTNWLLVGSDSRQGLSEEDISRYGTGGDLGGVSRTDTIMLLHIPRSGSATLISIPRDSYVEIPGYGSDKINSAFAYGGSQLLATTVEQNTGLRVDRYAEIGMGGLAGVVDAIGGVEICVQESIHDPLANLNIEPGCQKIDGPTGLGYVRTRATAQGDLDRVMRQREFLGALMSKLTSPAVFANPFRLVPLMWTVPSMFTVNQNDHIWNLARIALAMRGGLDTVTVPLGGFQDTEVGNVVLWDDAEAEALFKSLR